MAARPSTQAAEAQTPDYGWIARAGLGGQRVATALLNSSVFIGEIVIAMARLLTGKARMRMSDFWSAFQQCGPVPYPLWR